MTSMHSPPDFHDIVAAHKRLSGWTISTPLLRSPIFDRLHSSQVWLKAECLQLTGSFKYRGAVNRLSLLSPEERAHGVVAFSSGNHALAIAAAAARLGIRAGIVMPEDAPRPKINGVRALGAHIVLYDRHSCDREALARQLAQEWGAVLVPPYDDPHIIAGQGTVGLEMVEQIQAQSSAFDILLISCSGGGLLAGCALAFHRLSPKTRIYAVEPHGFDDTARSLAAGIRLANLPGGRTLCDALMVTTPGEITFDINCQRVAGGIAVSDHEVKEAMRVAFEHFKVVAEPGGATALAGFLQGTVDCQGKVVGIVLSGGNVNADLYASVLAERGELIL